MCSLGPALQNDIHNIEMVQRRAARFGCRDYRREAGVVSSLLEKLGWQTMQERREAARLTLLQDSQQARCSGHWQPTARINTQHEK